MTEQLTLLPDRKARRRLPRNPGRAARRKGHDWERELVHLLRPLFPGARRGVEQWRTGEPDVAGCDPLFIEAKRGKQTNPRAALRQAEESLSRHGAASPYRWPLAVCRDDGEPAFIVMRLEALLALLGAGKEATL